MSKFSGEDHRLAENEATWIDQAAGTPLQELSADALRVLASWYFDWQKRHAYTAKYYQQYGEGGRAVFVAERLAILAAVMGEEAFGALATAKHTEWVQACARTDAALRALAPCVTCGRSPDLWAEMDKSPLCGKCRSGKREDDEDDDWLL